MLPNETDILIVGAGPTGLALATKLQQAGVRHVLIDALDQGHNTSRAAVIHAHTLEMLAEIGVDCALEARGIQVSRFTVRDRDRPLLDVHFDALPSDFQHLLMVPQTTTESVLAERLTVLGGSVRRGVAALCAERDGDGAIVQVRTPTGEQSIKARFVIGADGMRSVIREAAGIAFEGETYGASFVLADVRMDWPYRDREVSLFFSPGGLMVIAPLPDGSYRIVATLDDAPEQPDKLTVQQLIDARGPTQFRGRVSDLIWGTRFRVHHRLADTYRNGPFVLLGDAAHVHSPAGGQGMNTGLVDAIVLGEALVRTVRDGLPETVLDEYADVRRPAARAVLTLAARLTEIATIRSAPRRMIRNLMLRFFNRLPPFKRKLMMSLSGLARREMSVLPKSTPAHTPDATVANRRREPEGMTENHRLAA